MSHPENKETRRPDEDVSQTLRLPLAERSAVPTASDVAWHLCVEVVGGPMDGLCHRVEASSFTIGRDPGNDLPLTLDKMVSSRHARIVREGRHFWLEDLGSRNGVFLGDRRLSERVLIGPGTAFTVGQTQLEFMPP